MPPDIQRAFPDECLFKGTPGGADRCTGSRGARCFWRNIRRQRNGYFNGCDNASCDRGIYDSLPDQPADEQDSCGGIATVYLRSAVLQHGAEQALCHYRNVSGMYYAFCSILYCYRAGASLSDHVCQKAEIFL